MREILTPEEIAALTAAFTATAPAGPRAPVAGVRPTNLANQERSLEGRLAGLELVVGRFGRGLRTVLASCFGDVPSVVTATLGLVRFDRLAPRLAEPAGLVRFHLSPLRGQGVLTIPSSLVAALLQVSCGGAGRSVTTLPARDFSPIELRLIERLATRVLAELRAAWEPIAPVECSLARVETTPLFANVAAPDELVVHAELAVVVAGLAPSTLTLVVPNASLDPIRPRLQTVRAVDEGGTPALDARWAEELRERLLDVPADVAVDLGRARLTLSRLLELAVGDLVPLDVGRDGPAVVRVAGRPTFHGAPGVQGGNNAVRITEPL
jgi:flagellar motor switch protein FliM